jgi:hypothetical protein
MDEPVRRGLRPARRRGLTSPDPVTHPQLTPAAWQAPTIPGTDPDKPQKVSGRQATPAVTHKISLLPRPPQKRSPEFTRWIEA